jgi:hypothetical protein
MMNIDDDDDDLKNVFKHYISIFLLLVTVTAAKTFSMILKDIVFVVGFFFLSFLWSLDNSTIF